MNKDINNEERIEIGDYVKIALTDKGANITNNYFYQIVANYKPDPRNDLNKIDTKSPLGSKLLYGKVGDTGEYRVCGYHYKYEILKIRKPINEKITIDEDFTKEKPKTKIRKKQ